MSDPAAGRFAFLSLLRLGGAFLVMFGILAARGFISLPVEAGYVMLALGLISFFVVPQILARRWRSPGAAEEAARKASRRAELRGARKTGNNPDQNSDGAG